MAQPVIVTLRASWWVVPFARLVAFMGLVMPPDLRPGLGEWAAGVIADHGIRQVQP